jgi:hypothetical protein
VHSKAISPAPQAESSSSGPEIEHTLVAEHTASRRVPWQVVDDSQTGAVL